MNTVLEYVIGLDRLNCHSKFCGDTISHSRENDIWSCYHLVVFRIFPNWNCHFYAGLWRPGCNVVRLYVLQSYHSCTFCKRKTRGETQFWIELAAQSTLANYNEINSDDTLPFIIFLTPVSCDGPNWPESPLASTLFVPIAMLPITS